MPSDALSDNNSSSRCISRYSVILICVSSPSLLPSSDCEDTHIKITEYREIHREEELLSERASEGIGFEGAGRGKGKAQETEARDVGTDKRRCRDTEDREQ